MRAYNLAMALIFVNAGFLVIIASGAFGGLLDAYEASIPSMNFAQVAAIAGTIGTAAAVSVLLRGGGQSGTSAALATFSGIYWSSNAASLTLFWNLSYAFPGLEIFMAIFFLAAILIFVNAMIQIPTGGQKSHV